MGFFVIFNGICVRLVYACHVAVCVWRVVAVNESYFGDIKIWLSLGILAFLGLMEAVWTLLGTKKGSYKWFCPITLLYLCGIVPCIWNLEWDIYNTRMAYLEQQDSTDCDPYILDQIFNVTKAPNLPTVVNFTLKLTDPEWSRGLQQVLLFILILGRWFAPKGKISRNQLSQLLLVYVGTSADILEFSTEGLQMEQVICNPILITCVLSIWSWSLLQFTLNLTVTLSTEKEDNKCRNMYAHRRRQRKKREKQNIRKYCGSCMCCETEVWAIGVSMVMQDIPFFMMRIYLLMVYEVTNEAGFFFTCKNALVLLLQIYRLVVIVIEYYKGRIRANVTRQQGDVIYAIANNIDIGTDDELQTESHLKIQRFFLVDGTEARVVAHDNYASGTNE
ncbi:transmembrane protein 26-like [Amphiura filiformis]|uniref:transmembrane protein 26-like n=1 Tax=Amphiura filiformis TaxID=82378 RepID=UPI003B20FF1B